ncbi:MAG: hypothetical protein NTY98_00585 [Verrucomicrobia bacterium]|nr:hypothetical protein [Verrucomicrobiota bacterium]
MKLSPLLLLAIALGAGLMPASAQDSKPMLKPNPAVRPRLSDVPPPPDSAEPEDTLLGANYRIVISATANGRKMGELAALTCTSPFQMTGYLVKPTAEDQFGASLAVRGALAEMEGGTLKLSYAMGMNAPVSMQTISLPGGSQRVNSTYSFKKTGTSGMLLLKPGQSYEVMKVTGVVYSLSITPTETPPAPANAKKQAETEPGAKPPAAAPAASQPSAESFRPENRKPADAARNGPIEEDRKRYESLSERAKGKFREAVRELFSHAEFRNAPEEERRERIRKTFEEAAAEDKAEKK